MRVVHENSRDRPGCLFFNLKIIGCDGSLYVHDQLVALKKRYQNIKKLPGSISAQNFESEELRSIPFPSRRRGLAVTSGDVMFSCGYAVPGPLGTRSAACFC
jgi:hypothetical protein